MQQFTNYTDYAYRSANNNSAKREENGMKYVKCLAKSAVSKTRRGYAIDRAVSDALHYLTIPSPRPHNKRPHNSHLHLYNIFRYIQKKKTKKKETNDSQHSHNFVSLLEPLLFKITLDRPAGTLRK